MTTWNVLIGVVELIDAPSADEARARLRAALIAAGFHPYDDGDAFESDTPAVGPPVSRQLKDLLTCDKRL